MYYVDNQFYHFIISLTRAKSNKEVVVSTELVDSLENESKKESWSIKDDDSDFNSLMGPAKSNNKVSSEYIFDKLKNIEKQQKILLLNNLFQQSLIPPLTLEEKKDESTKLILDELNDMKQQHQSLLHTQHTQQLMMQEKIHELEKQVCIANLEHQKQLQRIAESAASSLTMASLALKRRYAHQRQNTENDDQELNEQGNGCCGTFNLFGDDN